MALVLLINKRSTVLLTEGIHVLYIHTVHTHASVYIKIETFHFVLHVSYAPDLSVFAVLGVFVGLLLLMLFMAKPITYAVKMARMKRRAGRVAPLSSHTQTVQRSWEEAAAVNATDDGVIVGQVQV